MSSENQAETQMEGEDQTPRTARSPSASIGNENQELQFINSKNPLEDPTNPYYIHHGDNPVSKEISSSILYDESAANIWTDLKVRFHQRNGPHIYNLRKNLMNLKQEDLTIGMYFTKLKTVWEELANYRPSCTCNGCTCG
uniref:Retrotransposon gag domain-containing protein n=1 Tax=Cannabis sativa TaxID=3483 RepID=A0A803PVC4_CANSA